jgi:hypothetical protein
LLHVYSDLPIMIDHDFLFKELLTAFFVDFIDLFEPDLAGYLDKSPVSFLDKELFNDGRRHEADIVVSARCEHEEPFFLIHTEAQSQHQADFGKRLFHYFAKLSEKHNVPIYPIALLSFDRPKKVQPSEYVVAIPHHEVMRFTYRVIQLNRLDWRQFLNRRNPVAAALMAKMQIASKDRPVVKLECERLLTSLDLDWPRQRIISGFIKTYLKLNAEEEKQYMKERSKLPAAQQGRIKRINAFWAVEERQEGRLEGRLEIVLELLNCRLGTLGKQTDVRLQKLSPEQLIALSRALLNFGKAADLNQWLDSQAV